MPSIELVSNLKYITSGLVPTTEALSEGEFAFGLVGGVPKLFGNVGGVIQSFTPDSFPLSDSLPLMDGTASAGSALSSARADHKHPTDTSRASSADLQAEISARQERDSAFQSALDGKQSMIIGAASTVTLNNLTTNRVLISDANGKISISPVTSTELGYLSGAKSNIQQQVDEKYIKPVMGIPKVDLSQDVQTSLDHADSALQSVPDASASQKGIVTLGASGGAARYGQKGDVGLGNVDNTSDMNKPVSTAQAAAIKQEADAREAEDNSIKAELNNKYIKPSSGIPKTDLAESVQQSITKADTALQSIPIASPATIGGVKPVVKTSEMTQPVGINTSGELFTKPADFSEIANPNIIINSDFKINQRGASIYDSDNYGYTVDRWSMEGGSSNWTLGSVTPVSNGLKIKSMIGNILTVDQPIEEGLIVSGETYTLSATVDGVEKSISFAVSSTTRTLSFTYATVTFSTDSRTGADYKVSLNVNAGKTVTFNNVKLEKGAQATAYVEPDPAIELLRCQRFYHTRRYEVPIIYSPGKGNYGGGQVNFPVTMRVAPTITITGASISGNSSPLDDTYYNSVDQNGFFAYTGNSYNKYLRFSIRYTADAEI